MWIFFIHFTLLEDAVFVTSCIFLVGSRNAVLHLEPGTTQAVHTWQNYKQQVVWMVGHAT